MLRITDLKIDNKSLGDKFLLVDISPAYEYKDGERQDTVSGYKYSVCLPKFKMEKLVIKVSNLKPLFDLEKEEIPYGTEVNFKGLDVGSYSMDGQIRISAKAEDVFMVKN